MAPSNPLFLKEAHTQRAGCACVSVRVCRTGLSVPSHTPVVLVIPGSKTGPVARQPYRPRSRPISILHLEERGLRTLRQSQVAQKKKYCHHPSSAQRCKTVQKPISEYSWFLRNTRRLPLVVYFCGALQNLCLFLWLTLSDINTAYPGDQETAPLRAQPHFDWLPWSSWRGNSYQGSLMLCNANPAPVVDQSAMIVLGFFFNVWWTSGLNHKKNLFEKGSRSWSVMNNSCFY